MLLRCESLEPPMSLAGQALQCGRGPERPSVSAASRKWTCESGWRQVGGAVSKESLNVGDALRGRRREISVSQSPPRSAANGCRSA